MTANAGSIQSIQHTAAKNNRFLSLIFQAATPATAYCRFTMFFEHFCKLPLPNKLVNVIRNIILSSHSQYEIHLSVSLSKICILSISTPTLTVSPALAVE